VTLSGAISDGTAAGELIVRSMTTSGGVLTLTNTNSYMGVTELMSGATLALKGSGSIADSLYVAFASGGTLNISQTTAGTSIGGLFDPLGTAKVSLGSQTLTITTGSIFDGIIQDGGIGGGTGGGLTVTGGADQQLAGVNTYTGLTTIDVNGELDLFPHSGQNGSIADSRAVIDNGDFDISNLGNGVTPASTSIKSLSGTNGAAFVYLGLNQLTNSTRN
jgi:hypothetical protein